MNTKNFSSRRVCVLAAAALASSTVFAQDELEETVITATRTPVPVDSVGAPVIVLTRADIERSLATDVSDLLQHAGLEISRNGGPGQTTSLFTRGTESNHTVVLIDGVRINPGTIGGAALQNLAPESLERIEIVKGPRSSLYGTDAIGGVVQLFTRNASRSGVSGGATFGSDATQQFFGDAAYATDKAKIGFGGGYSESDGIPTYTEDTLDRGWRNTSARLTGEIAVTDEVKLRARGFHTVGRTEYTEQDFFTGDFLPRSNDFENSVYSLEGEYRRADGAGIRATFSRTTDDIDQLQPGFGPTPFDYARTRRGGVDLQADFARVGGHGFSVGFFHSDENTRAQSFGTVFDEDTRVTQAFVQDQFEVGRFNTRIALGGVDHETFGAELTWNAEVGVAFDTGTRVSVSGGRAFRAPDSTDRFGFGGNPDLDPEVSRQVELNVRQKLGEHHQFSLAAFDNRIRDLVEYVVTDFVTFDGENRNVDRARIKGVELGYRYANEGWRVRAGLTFQDPRDEELDARLLRRSRESAVVALNRDIGKFDLGLDVAAFGNRKDFGFPVAATLDSYVLVNATARYRISDALLVQGRLENAMDVDYVFAQGYRTRGRAYTVGVRYSFE
ncbi:MAG: TonB-dependent receptor [Steroidobacteraceae bacterium]|nr:TonB-dependent receptor [Steroidobacteraceae bacterium]